MHTVDIRKAKKHLSTLVGEASRGKAFIISKAGIPMVKVTAVNSPTDVQVRRLGFLKGEILIPDDFGRMKSEQIQSMFSSGK
jgi:antitoxin (DNA-binding transcriptional repressor) of toxin-antitoxin stability system